MVSPKQLTLLAAAGVAASLFLAQPARALTAIAQPYLISIDQGRVDAVQAIGHRRWHGYRGGWRGYYRPSRRYGLRRYGYYGPWQRNSGLPYWRRFPGLPYKPWGHYEPCVNCPAFK
jgi:hypothetical protein